MVKRYFKPSEGSFFLFGPRGCGKTTWYSDCCRDAHVLDLLDLQLYRDLTAQPELFTKIIEGGLKTSNVIIVDEIQRIPDLLSAVHALIERRPSLRFILTGSSVRKIKRRGVDLLGGRAELKKMHPFMASELSSQFNLEKALSVGLVPLIYVDKNPEARLRSYISLYIQEEVHYEGLVRNAGAFNRFLRSIALSHASVLNISSVARDCQVERKVVENYISILEDLLIARRIYPFEKRAKRKLIHHPKFFLFDSGVFNALRPKGPMDPPDGIGGMALEGLVEHHIRAWVDYSETDTTYYFWKTAAGAKVDFVIYGELGLYAIEVKNAQRVRPEDLRGLKSFMRDYPEATPILLYRGRYTLKESNVTCMPCEEFLSGLLPGKALPV
jgi:predicted AAA+ superfamily ATPase